MNGGNMFDIVTTFKEGNELGEKFVKTCTDNWQRPLVYHDLPRAKIFREWAEGFLWGFMRAGNDKSILKNYRYHAHRFHWKVYALYEALVDTNADHRKTIWLSKLYWSHN